MELVTSFGAAFAAPAQTSAVLRARAGALGLDQRPVAVADLMVAVVAAHAFASALGVSSLSEVRHPDAAAALAAIYCRAAGHGHAPVPDAGTVDGRCAFLADRLAELGPGTLPVPTLVAITAAADWVHRHVPADVPPEAVLVAAAEDLATGWGHPTLVAVSDTLTTLAR